MMSLIDEIFSCQMFDMIAYFRTPTTLASTGTYLIAPKNLANN